MARSFTANFNRTINSVEASEFPLVLLEVDHADLSVPIRVVNDYDNITSNGDLYQRFAFRFSGVADPETGLAEATLAFDNVGREFMQWVEIADFRKPVTVRIQVVRRSDPDEVEYETTMFLDDIIADPTSIEGRLSYNLGFDIPLTPVVYNKQKAPGLFT